MLVQKIMDGSRKLERKRGRQKMANSMKIKDSQIDSTTIVQQINVWEIGEDTCTSYYRHYHIY